MHLFTDIVAVINLTESLIFQLKCLGTETDTLGFDKVKTNFQIDVMNLKKKNACKEWSCIVYTNLETYLALLKFRIICFLSSFRGFKAEFQKSIFIL